MELKEYLATFCEDCPEWLKNFDSQYSVFNSKIFLKSRVVFYPGASYDGHAIKLFSSTHSAHCFVYCDYLTTKEEIEKVLDGDDRGYQSPILGYHSIARLSLIERELSPNRWEPHVQPDNPWARPRITPYAFLEIFERNSDLKHEFGAERLAILFLGADAYASYDALFCQNNGNRPPFSIFLQDHGFGGNYDRFGNDGLMHQIAKKAQVFPELLIVAKNTRSWNGFEKVEDVEGENGGMHSHLREIYKKINSIPSN